MLLAHCRAAGGSEEERAAELIAANMTRPVAAYIADSTAPPVAR